MGNFDHNPVSHVIWVPIEKVRANDYNPNEVAKVELGLLRISILKDGYTQPIVTYWNEGEGVYEIVDGYHRYHISKSDAEIREINHGCVPIVVIDKPLNERKASTIRHNRARGRHGVAGMSHLVLSMLADGWEDERICDELGMEAEELVRLKYISGFAKLYEDREYSKAWVPGFVRTDEKEISEMAIMKEEVYEGISVRNTDDPIIGD